MLRRHHIPPLDRSIPEQHLNKSQEMPAKRMTNKEGRFAWIIIQLCSHDGVIDTLHNLHCFSTTLHPATLLYLHSGGSTQRKFAYEAINRQIDLPAVTKDAGWPLILETEILRLIRGVFGQLNTACFTDQNINLQLTGPNCLFRSMYGLCMYTFT